jgi:DnaJ domain
VELNSLISHEIDRIAELTGVDCATLEAFAQFAIANHRKKSAAAKPKAKKPKIKALGLAQLKAAVFKHFGVLDVTSLRKNATFVMSTNGVKVPLKSVDDWASLYRKFVGILPGEDCEEGSDCINGINIFKYARPWRTFGLDPATATTEDIKAAYRTLSKIYHPDVMGTGNAQVFERLTVFYNSLTEKF